MTHQWNLYHKFIGHYYVPGIVLGARNSSVNKYGKLNMVNQKKNR